MAHVHPFYVNSEQHIKTVVDYQIEKLEMVRDDGLASVYESWWDYLCDYWPDFSWSPEILMAETEACLKSEKWLMVAAEIKAKHGFDFVQELKEGHNEAKENI